MRNSTVTPARGVHWLLAGCIVLSSGFANTAQAANKPPVFSGWPVDKVQVNAWYNYVPTVSDPDKAPKALKFSIANKPAWATFSTTTGQLKGTPTSPGTWSNIKISASDGAASASQRVFSITVSGAANRAPVISGSPATSASVGAAYSFRPTASDADGNALGFSIQNRPTWATFSTSTGQLSGTPTSAHVGTFSNIVIKVSDGKLSATLPAFAIKVAATNAAPVISGSPATSVQTGSSYSFTPGASDANGDSLSFTVQNLPSWASFDVHTGKLSGTPKTAATHSNIVIRVSDGKLSKALPTFSIKVTQAAASTSPGTATLSWEAPMVRENGTPMSNLAGYRIHYGKNASQLHETVHVDNPGLTSYVLQNLAPGTYYFAVRAFDGTGATSALSNVKAATVK